MTSFFLTLYSFDGSFYITDKIYVLNGETVTMAVTPIVLSPSISTVEFVYTTDPMIDDGMGNLIVDVGGFPAYITFDSDPMQIAFTVEPDEAMASGDTHPIQIEATCQ